MSAREIKELRLAGRLEEALAMASDCLEADPNNIWNKRAIVWVLYEYLKKNIEEKSFEGFSENLLKIKALQLPDDEKMVFDSCAWQIGKFAFLLQNEATVDYRKIGDLFDIIKDFSFTKPSEAYSFLYKAFHKGHQSWSRYLEFSDWWGFENFMSTDYQSEIVNGKKIMALVEQAYIAYSKKLLAGQDRFGLISHPPQVNIEKINAFLSQLDHIIANYRGYQYPAYYKAKLLISLGKDTNALDAFRPFALQKRNDFWVWDLLAEIHADDKDIQLACYCKALSLTTPEEYLVKIRQNLASLLIARQMYCEAKTEIDKIVATRNEQGWRIPAQITQWSDQRWFKSASANTSNTGLYKKYINRAEEILFQDIPEETIVVEFVNDSKGMLSFVKDKSKTGYFKFSNKSDKPLVGDILSVRFKGEGKEGYYEILTIRRLPADATSQAIKEFQGELKIIDQQNFGFVGDIFVEPKLIKANHFNHMEAVSGKAILTLNKRKNQWGWKAITIQNVS